MKLNWKGAWLFGLMAGITLLVAQPLWAASFTECPNYFPPPDELGLNAFAGCSVLITVKPDLTATIAFNKQSDVEDALVGVRNLSSLTLAALRLTGEEIFDFDKDFGLPYGLTGYEGPGVSFSDLVFYYNPPGSLNRTDGTVNFALGIAPGGSAYFGLEGADTEGLSVLQVAAVPLPSTGLLIVSGLIITVAMVRRRGHPART